MLRGYNGTRSVKQDDEIALFAKRDLQHARSVLENAQNADDRRRINRPAQRLVVKADVASRNRSAQLIACDGQALDYFAELRHHFRLFRAAEVEAVGRSHRTRAARSNVASRFADCVHRSDPRIQLAPAAIAT